MRRHATMVFAFVMPLAVSFAASAQPQAAQGGAAAPATAPAKAADAAKPAAPAVDGATYAVRLRDLESRVDELKDQIRRSHTRLSLLSDSVMSGGMAGSRADIVFQNEMSSAFRLIRALVVMDGSVQYNRQDETGALADQKEIPIFSGSVPPGDHTLQVLLNYQGNGYGVFTYLRGYKFEVKSSHAFTVTDGKSINVTIIGLEKGGVTTPLEQRPAIDWREKINGLAVPAPAAPGGAMPGAPAPAGGAAAPAGGAVAPAGGASGSINVGGGSK